MTVSLLVSAGAREVRADGTIVPSPAVAGPVLVTGVPEQPSQASTVTELPPPPHQLSERALQVKTGLLRPEEPGATPVEFPSSPTSAPSLGFNFEGNDQFDQGFGTFPPDGGLGASNLYVVQVTNAHIAYYTKDGQKVFEADPTTLFGSPNQLVDPDVQFDPGSNRFFFAAFNRTNQLYFAASVSDNPRDGWCTYFTIGAVDSAPDFTQMGISPTAFLVGLNGAAGNHTVWYNKSQMVQCVAGSNLVGFQIQGLTHCDNATNVFSLRPARMFGGGNVAFLAGTDSTSDVTIWRINDPVGSPSLNRACVGTGVYFPPPNAPQPGGGFPLETGDERALEVVFRDNHLYIAHNGAGGSCTDTGGSCCTLFFKEIDVGLFPTLGLVQDTFFNVGNLHLLYPTIDVDSSHRLAIGSSFVSVAQGFFAGAQFTGRDGAGTFDGNLGVLAFGQTNQQQLFPDSRNRWGDYFGSCVDPCFNKGQWVFAEYAGPNNTWSTRIGDVFGGAPPGNDACSAAVNIPIPTNLTADTTFATFSESDPNQTCSSGGPGMNNASVWYTFTAPGNGTVNVNTSGSNYDTVLTVDQGSCSGLTELACNDDSGGTLQSNVNVPVQCRAGYNVEVTEFLSPNCATQTLDLNASFTPTPACNVVTAIPAAGGTILGNTCGVSTLTGTCGGGSAPEKVYQWTPNVSGVATIDTCGSGTLYDTVLYIRNSPCATGTELACNDDFCVIGDGSGHGSRVTPTVTAGQPYFIIVDGFFTTQGNFTLHVAPPTVATTTTTSTTTTTTTTMPCATPVLACPQTVPPNASFVADVAVNVGSRALGAYSVRLTWNPAQVRVDSVSGGTTSEFSGTPTCNIDNTAGTAACSAFQTSNLNGPTGIVHIARANATALAATGTMPVVTLTLVTLFDTQDRAICIGPSPNACTFTVSGICGDVNGDQVVNIGDALVVAQYTVGLRTCGVAPFSQPAVCDVNSDSGCNIGDALKMAQCDVHLIGCMFTCRPFTCP